MYHKGLTTILQFQTFNEEYVRRLADGDPAAGDHFAKYFDRVLYLKLRVRLRSPELIEDVKQETMLRVLAILRQGEGVKSPDRFGAFVNAVCNNVVREMCRLDRRYEAWDEYQDEPSDPTVNMDGPLMNADMQREIEKVLAALQERDRRILRAIYLEEVDKAEVCRRFGVDSSYLRVLIHRAKSHFREEFGKPEDRRN